MYRWSIFSPDQKWKIYTGEPCTVSENTDTRSGQDTRQLNYETWQVPGSTYERSHRLRSLCEEVDFTVDTLRNLNGVSGARMIGGGFGGSVLALCEKSEREKIVEFVRERYFEKFNIAMDAYEVRPSRGAGEIRE